MDHYTLLAIAFFNLTSDEKDAIFELSKLITDTVQTDADLQLALKLQKDFYLKMNPSLWHICVTVETIIGF